MIDGVRTVPVTMEDITTVKISTHRRACQNTSGRCVPASMRGPGATDATWPYLTSRVNSKSFRYEHPCVSLFSSNQPSNQEWWKCVDGGAVERTLQDIPTETCPRTEL
jgi:hypothetical protein